MGGDGSFSGTPKAGSVFSPGFTRILAPSLQTKTPGSLVHRFPPESPCRISLILPHLLKEWVNGGPQGLPHQGHFGGSHALRELWAGCPFWALLTPSQGWVSSSEWQGGKRAEKCLPLSAALVIELSFATDGGVRTHFTGVAVTGK